MLHAIRLVCDALAASLSKTMAVLPRATTGTEIQVCSHRDTVVSDPARLSWIADWRQLFTDGNVGEGVALEVALDFEPRDSMQSAIVTLAYGRNAQLKMGVTVRCRAAVDAIKGYPPRSKFRSSKLREELAKARPLAVFVPAFYGVTRLEEYRVAAKGRVF